MLLAKAVLRGTQPATTTVISIRRGEIDTKPSRETSRITNTASVDLGLMPEKEPPEPISSLAREVIKKEVVNE